MNEEEVSAGISLAILSFVTGVTFNGTIRFSSYLSVISLLIFSANILLQVQKVCPFNKSRRLKEALVTFVLGMLTVNSFSYMADYLPLRLQIYIASLGLYHYMEYLYVCYFHYVQLTFDSFLLNQSPQYMIAVLISFIEFSLFYNYYDMCENLPSFLSFGLTAFGLIMIIVGHFFRIGAEFTAGYNFNHKIQFYKEDRHKLVTDGLYSVCRHPSYLGWFLWAVGTQLFLLNPVSTLLFFGSSWYFFRHRIEIEEEILYDFFKDEYRIYCSRTPILIPFINGFQDYE
ncbi:protein-s-isoprenylcysteine o-methyltransferase [Stylonychia lemnae]|uniref:Protein-S-isoprenylcysteine O-methyltransferase n=1 Tax=Stylonychia lemnae TaxID=5949 RepID=A0A078A2M0_STYLE|nr:protein-s-isoprenylcysteine o-methyltransferase [Stylonychia lemnae]|eukprot:CDW76072.1 protein-s-isoprenylcysteine o-methyltransferase [Stylonychia lemnae]